MGENMFEIYLRLQKEKKVIEEEISDCQVFMYNMNAKRFDETDNGTVHYEQDGYRLSVVKKETVKVDQKMAEVVGLAFSKKYSIEEDRKRVEECLTTAPAKPSFKVEVME